MTKEQARDLVQQTFTHKFNKPQFLNFLRNLLNHIDESKASPWNSQYIKDAFKSHVQRYERLGTYVTPKKETVDLLVVYLTNESKLERARTAIRNFVADHLKTRDEKDAALVAFVSPTEATWRFSYVKMEYATVENESGRLDVEPHLTPARRFSYIVGEGESCHTAQARFVSLLQATAVNPTLADLQEAFSVEAVSKEFFTQYAELFEDIHKALNNLLAENRALRDEFAIQAVSTVDFAKKLMGQIVFLYFLQKKGWLGVAKGADWGNGPRDFLRRLAKAEYGNHENFFNDILEPLFYDTLATDRGHEAWCNRFKCRIPFLNGGLFEPPGNYNWRKIEIALPNKLFTNNTIVEEGVTGTGVLDVFDRYNFTVNESEPLEKEVAIDPEMLGKVFENLIEENRRKGLGSYYTPREIVHFMCAETLITYLDTALNSDKEVIPRTDLETLVRLGEQYSFYEAAKQAGTVGKSYPKPPQSIEKHARLIDDKLSDITVCDPAVGSGAFPVGLMTEIVRTRSALTPYFNDPNERSPYHLKRHAIQSCLYGVDIDSGAIEIARLRLWLSLVVDEEEVKQIKPLPNLDYKIVAGNSLVRFPFKTHGLSELEDLKRQFFDSTDQRQKAQLKLVIDKKLNECFASSKKSLGYQVSFDFEVVFSEVFHRKRGFDIVIGNPPYVSAVKDAQDPENLRWVYKKQYPILKGAFDLYVVFLLLADRITSGRGCYAWIVPNKLLVADYAKEIVGRLKSTGLHAAVDVSTHHVFEAGVYPIVIFGNKSSLQAFTRYGVELLDDLHARNLVVKNSDIRQYKTFKDQGLKFGSGATGFQAQDLVRCLAEVHKAQSIPFVVSGCIDRYCISFNNVRYMGTTYKQAYIKNDGSIAASKWSFWLKEKIVIAGMTKKIEAVYASDPLALGVGVYAIGGFGRFLPKFLVGVLNSKFLSYFLRQKFSDKHLAGGYLAINKSTLEQLPLVDVPLAEQQAIAGIVNEIITAKRGGCDADTSWLEKEIDRRVYGLYGLTAAEIERAEKEAAENAVAARINA